MSTALHLPQLPYIGKRVAAPTVKPFLACERCAHVSHQVDGLHCTLRRSQGQGTPVVMARGRLGYCGPDARHQVDVTDTPPETNA